MAWAYVWAVIAWALIPAAKRGGKLLVPAILMLGVLPDVDLFLGGIGVVHRTVTHSFFLWAVLFIPFFFIFRLKAIPYFVAVVQHFAFGDFLMGTRVMIFWPFNSKFYGLSFGMPSLVDVALETAGLLLATGIIVYNGDLRRLLSIDKRNVLMLLPLMALSVSALFFISHWSPSPFIEYILSSKLLIAMALANMILFVFLAISALQGLRAFRHRAN